MEESGRKRGRGRGRGRGREKERERERERERKRKGVLRGFLFTCLEHFDSAFGGVDVTSPSGFTEALHLH